MGRNAAFGRPQAHERLRDRWYATGRTTRFNALLVLAVAAVVVALLNAATSRDASRPSPLANATRPQLTFNSIVTSTSTTLVGSLFAAGAPSTPADLFGPSSTTSSTVAVAPTVPAAPAPAARTTVPPATTTTLPPEPATTVPNPGVIFSEVPPRTPTTTTPVTAVPVTTSPPVTAAPSTTAPPTTAPPIATTPTTAAPGVRSPLGLPPLLGPG